MSLRFLFSPNICPLYIKDTKKQDAKIPRKPKFLPVRIFRSLKNPEIGSSTLAKPLKNLFPRNLYTRVEILRAISATMFLLSGLGVIDIVSGSHKGGLLGEILSTPFMSLFDTYASIIFLGAILIISILVIFDAKLDMALLFKKLWNLIKKEKNTEPVEVKESTAEVAEDEKTEEEEETTGEKIKKALGIHKNINKEDEEEEM